MARKPSAVARELLRNFPSGKRRQRRKGENNGRGGRRRQDAERNGTKQPRSGANPGQGGAAAKERDADKRGTANGAGGAGDADELNGPAAGKPRAVDGAERKGSSADRGATELETGTTAEAAGGSKPE